MPVYGGTKARRYIRRMQSKMTSAPKKVTVGYMDKRMAGLAMLHEYGDPDISLPERPALRNGIDIVKKEGKKEVAKLVKQGGGVISRSAARKLGEDQRDTLIGAYREFKGKGLAVSTRKRYGRDEELKGEGDYKLAHHISVEVD